MLFAALLALMLWVPLPWGSNILWAKNLLALAAAALLGLWLLGAGLGWIRPAPGRPALLGPLLWWGLWLGWVAAALLPWPSEWLTVLSPEAARLQAEAAAQGVTVLGGSAILPAETAESLLLSAGYACLYLLVILLCHGSPQRARQVLAVLVVSGLLQALYGTLMVLSGLEWGFLQAKQAYQGLATGTFVNRNHLAGYLELCAAAALGLILGDLAGRAGARTWRQWGLDFIAMLFSRKVRVRFALVIMAIGLVMTRSRMGNVAFFTALMVCGLGYILLRHRERAFGAFVLFGSVLIVDLLIVTRLYGLEQLVERLEQTTLETDGRAWLLAQLPPVIEAYSAVGAGLGSFATAFAAFNPGGVRSFFLHAHNDYLQFLIEVGWPGVLLLAAFVLVHALHALRVIVRRKRPQAAGIAFAALMAMMALGLHSLTDFNLQIPANAATLLVLLALAASVSSRSSRARRVAGDGSGERLHSGNEASQG